MKNQRNKESIIGEAVDSDSYRGINQMVLEIIEHNLTVYKVQDISFIDITAEFYTDKTPLIASAQKGGK